VDIYIARRNVRWDIYWNKQSALHCLNMQEDPVSADQKRPATNAREKNGGFNTAAAGQMRPKVLCLQGGSDRILSRLRLASNCMIQGVTSNPGEFIARVVDHKPDLVLVDLDIEGLDMMEYLMSLRSEFPTLAILAISDNSEPGFIEAVLKGGATGYIHTLDDSDAISSSLQHVLQGEMFVSEKLRGKVLRRLLGDGTAHGQPPVHLLSAREAQVFRYLGQTYTIREIAQELALSSRTVETYRDRIREKLQVSDSRQLVLLALRWVIDQGRSDS
jgi:DNA-binding NarL/FixJ family response regulator